MPQIADPDVLILATFSQSLQADYPADGEWTGSPFAWIKSRPSRQVGAIGEKLVAGFLAAKGFDVVRSPDAEADRLINGVRAEIKFSTLWRGGSYKFQQFRNQDYEFVICLGVSPFDAHCWAIPKHEVLRQWGAGKGLSSQHAGRQGTDTAWLDVQPAHEPAWLRACGGRLRDAAAQIARLTGTEPLP